MYTIPFYDFDEAHRAENAKMMKEYGSWLVPLGGSYDKVEKFKIPLKENPNLYLYYHVERPPFVYWLMILSTFIFGETEWAYRLPSFLLGISTILAYYIFAQWSAKKNQIALFMGFLALVTSSDLWLSSQYAQLDTGLTLFLFISLLSLIFYCGRKNLILLFISGFSFAFAFLSKGQPAAIFIFPLLFLLLHKKITVRELLIFLGSAGILLVPWLTLLSVKFNFFEVVKIFFGFGFSSYIESYLHIQAPIFWYARWWWETLRPGWTLFLALMIFDLANNSLTWQKKALLSFIVGGLVLFSASVNKIWWYVLPLLPAIAFYICLSASDYLKNNKRGVVNLSMVILLASLPLLLGTTNRISLLYGILVSAVSFLILINKKLLGFPFLAPKTQALFLISITLSLLFFYIRFPTIVPYHWETKEVAQYYSRLSGNKCLQVYDMPTEAALFYSNAGQINPLVPGKLFPNCDNYLLTPTNNENEILFPYFQNAKLIFKIGVMKLFKLN